MGGYSGFNKGIVYKTVEVYDPVTDTWSAKSDMITGRFSLGASVYNERIYVFGGVIVGQTGSGVEDSTVEEYDPISDTWTQMPDMPTRRASLCASIVNGKIYTIGGGPVSGTAIIATPTVEEYAPDDLSSSVVSPKGKSSKTWGDIRSR